MQLTPGSVVETPNGVGVVMYHPTDSGHVVVCFNRGNFSVYDTRRVEYLHNSDLAMTEKGRLGGLRCETAMKILEIEGCL